MENQWLIEDTNDNIINNNTGNNEHIGAEQPTNLTFPPQINRTLFNYRLEKLLRSDTYCAVFVAHYNDVINVKYIAKIAIGTNAVKRLARELKNYKILDGIQRIPKLHFQITWESDEDCDWLVKPVQWSMIVIEKLGADLEHYLNNFRDRKIPIDWLLPIAVQQITLLESIHAKGLIHRGVKPDNFVLSLNNDSIVYVIDFNRAKSYLNRDKKHCEYERDDKLPKGNALFHSLNYHNGVRRTRRDDLESLGLCWVYMLKHELPWSNKYIKRTVDPIEQYYEYIRKVGEKMRNTSIDVICKGLPSIFEIYLTMCRELKYDETPNYEKMRKLFTDYNEKINHEEIW